MVSRTQLPHERFLAIPNFFPNGHTSLKVPNVEYDFDAYVDSIQFITHSSKA